MDLILGLVLYRQRAGEQTKKTTPRILILDYWVVLLNRYHKILRRSGSEAPHPTEKLKYREVSRIDANKRKQPQYNNHSESRAPKLETKLTARRHPLEAEFVLSRICTNPSFWKLLPKLKRVPAKSHQIEAAETTSVSSYLAQGGGSALQHLHTP